METRMPILNDGSTTEKVGFLVAVGSIIGSIWLAIAKLFRYNSEHEQLMAHLHQAEEMLPRFIATEEAVEYLKKTQQEQLAELRGIRSDLSSLMTRLIAKLDQ